MAVSHTLVGVCVFRYIYRIKTEVISSHFISCCITSSHQVTSLKPIQLHSQSESAGYLLLVNLDSNIPSHTVQYMHTNMFVDLHNLFKQTYKCTCVHKLKVMNACMYAHRQILVNIHFCLH